MIIRPGQRIIAIGGGVEIRQSHEAAFIGAYDAIPNIVHAYEPARRTLSAYTGNLVRLRRASATAENDFGYLGNGDLNVAVIAAWAGGAAYVVTVYDQAGGDDITQGEATKQFLYVASAQNGHAGMASDGNDKLTGAFSSIVTQPLMCFAVAQLSAGAVDDGNFRSISDGVGANRCIMGKKAAVPDVWAFYAGGWVSGGAVDSNWNVWSALFNGASGEVWLNGTSEMSGNAGAVGLNLLNLSVAWIGHIVSFVVVDAALSDAQRIAMQTAMNTYWNVF